MNKKEVSELRKNLSDDSGFFTINSVLTAFIDTDKKVRVCTVRPYSEMLSEELEVIRETLKKVLSTSVGKSFVEYQIPTEQYQDDGIQPLLYNLVKEKFQDDELVDRFVNRVAKNIDYTPSFAILSAHCTYTVKVKNKNDDFNEDNNLDYNFMLTGFCQAELSDMGLVFSQDELFKKVNTEFVVGKSANDGFLYPTFSDRSPDVNSIMYYTKTFKKPNLSIIEDILGCEFVMSAQSEKEEFQSILKTVVGDDLNYNVITTINDKIKEIIDFNKNDTETTTIDKNRLKNILLEVGVDNEKLLALDTVYETSMDKNVFTATNIVDTKTVISTPEVTVNISQEGVQKVRTSNINGRRCIVIDVDDPSVEINGLYTKV
ncbi:MAG: DUF4317 domain-containing protein [Ruminococcus sp.]|nr:DUF4317 domain-containing protein [Ruminococcus sp.]MCD7800226.1 DUF4317 domain-containing protein [Ruminococcus sp.]